MSLLAAIGLSVIATTLVAVVPTCTEAIRDAGVRAALSDANPPDAGVQATFRLASVEWPSVPTRLDLIASDMLPVATDELLIARSDAYRFVARDDLPDRWITGFASVSGGMLRTVAEVVEAPDGVVATRLHVDAAAVLGLRAGDRISVERSGRIVELVVVALVEPVDRSDRRWWHDTLVRDGVTPNGSFTEIGPFLVDVDQMTDLGGSMNITWRLLPASNEVGTSDLQPIRRGVESLRSRIDDELRPTGLSVATGLPATVDGLAATVTTSGAVIGAVLLQLVVVALAAVGLSASVLATGRTGESDVLRSRGAGREQRAVLAVSEGVLVAVVAVAIGPVAAVPVVERLEQWGPIATSGLDLRPAAPPLAWLLAAGVGVLIVGLVAWPSLRSGEPTERSGTGRTLLVQRGGLDIAVAAVAVLGLWRLSASGFASTNVTGRLGVDPVLVLAPALAVVAVTLLTLRLALTAAGGADRFLGRSRSLSVALGAREAARDQIGTARLVTIVVLSACVATMASIQSATWDRSAVDRADARVSADAFADLADGPVAAAIAPFVPAALERLDGVGAVFPVDLTTASLAGGRSVPLVATDTRALGEATRIRDDLLPTESRASLAALYRPVDLGGVVVQDDENGADLTVAYRLRADGVPVSGSVRVRFVVMDGDGTTVSIGPEPLNASDSAGVLRLSIVTDLLGDDVTGLRPPVRLVSIEATFPSVQDQRPVAAPGDPVDSARFDLDLGPATLGDRNIPLDANWRIGAVDHDGTVGRPSSSVSRTPGGFRLGVDSGSTRNAAGSVTIAIDTAPLADGVGDGVPVLSTEAFLARSSLAVGDRVVARLDGVVTELIVAGTVPVVPFAVGAGAAVIADRETVAADRLDRSRRFVPPTGWALTLEADEWDPVAIAVADATDGLLDVDDRRNEARRVAQDPVLVGLAGGWGLAVVAAPMIAVIGLVVAAVASARDRRSWVAILRSMGVRTGELLRWRLATVVPTVVGASVTGVLAGIGVVRWTVSVSITTSDGSTPVPPPMVVVPWATLALIVGILCLTAVVTSTVVADRLRRRKPGEELRGGTW